MMFLGALRTASREDCWHVVEQPGNMEHSFLPCAGILRVCGGKRKEEVPRAEIPLCQLVRMKGLEPPRPKTLDPKSNAATITPHARVKRSWCRLRRKVTIYFLIGQLRVKNS